MAIATHRFEESDELRLVVRAESFAAVLAEAGRALAELADRTDEREIAEGGWSELEVTARDRPGLLVEWLNELIFRADSQGRLGVEFEMLETSHDRVRARVRSRSWPSRSFPVKAATLDRARVADGPTGVTAEVTLDV